MTSSKAQQRIVLAAEVELLRTYFAMSASMDAVHGLTL